MSSCVQVSACTVSVSCFQRKEPFSFLISLSRCEEKKKRWGSKVVSNQTSKHGVMFYIIYRKPGSNTVMYFFKYPNGTQISLVIILFYKKSTPSFSTMFYKIRVSSLSSLLNLLGFWASCWHHEEIFTLRTKLHTFQDIFKWPPSCELSCGSYLENNVNRILGEI